MIRGFKPAAMALTCCVQNPSPSIALFGEEPMTRYNAADGTLHYKLTVPLTAYAVIAGRVTDPYGLPAEDCRISVIAMDGSPVRPSHAFAAALSSALTD